MPVIGTPTPPAVVTETEIRMWLRDYALGHLPGGQGNLLLDDVQFTRDELTFSVKMAVSNFNAITPLSSFLVDGSNFPNEYLLLLGVARFLMVSESFHQLRNQASVQDGDIAPSGIYDKSQAYLGLAQMLKAEWDQLTRMMKNQFNMEGAYSYLGSGYKNVGRSRV
jgi:hypothetical protein